MPESTDETEAGTSGTVIAHITAYAEGQVTPGPGQTWDDVPEESRPPEHRTQEDD